MCAMYNKGELSNGTIMLSTMLYKDVVTTRNERNDAEVSDQHHTQTNDIAEEAKVTGNSNLVVPNDTQQAELGSAVADKRIELLSQDITDPSLTEAMNEHEVVQVEVDEEIDGGKENEVKMCQVNLADGTIIVVPRSQIEVGQRYSINGRRIKSARPNKTL